MAKCNLIYFPKDGATEQVARIGTIVPSEADLGF